jgi:hypothetical protein
MRASELAAALNLSKGRISQLVADDTLKGCYQGDGRARIFDLDKCAAALQRGLDRGQMLGNGAKTKARIRDIVAATDDLPMSAASRALPAPRDGSELQKGDQDRYDMARAARAEEDLRAMRLKNGRDEGQYVLASEVSREVARAIGQEVREVESYIRETARMLADQMGVDFKAARQIMMDGWRKHRGDRAEVLVQAAAAAQMSDAEFEADI